MPRHGRTLIVTILCGWALAHCGEDSNAPPPRTCVDYRGPSRLPETQAATSKNEPGTTRWFAVKSMRQARAYGQAILGFDLDGRVTCDDTATGCLDVQGKHRLDRDQGIDNVLVESTTLSALALGAGATLEFDVGFVLLLRLDDVGADQDASAPGALYFARTLEGGAERAEWSSGERWIVDAASLEDGVSLDRPRWRFPKGFVSAGRWWSGAADAALQVELPGQSFSTSHVPIPMHIRVATIDLKSEQGEIAGFVRADEAAPIAEAWRRYGACRTVGGQPDAIILGVADLVGDGADLQRDGVPCDAASFGLGLDAVPTSAPTSVAVSTPPPVFAIDACRGDRALSCSSSDVKPIARGPTHGLRADGRVDVTAADAWPGRPTEPALPSGPELARACATLAACLYVDDLAWGFGSSVSEARAAFAHDCANPTRYLDGGFLDFALRDEEHGVPLSHSNERLVWLLQVALEAKGDCSKIRAAETPLAPGLSCGPYGCGRWCGFTSGVSCAGSIATLVTNAGTFQRDCSHAFATCDPSRSGGCTDRPIVACDPLGTDRCDGAIHLGCDSFGFVSFRDCARYGGTCEETGPGEANCTYPYPECEPPTCSGHTLNLCTLGVVEAVDCVTLGFTGCAEGRCH